MTASEERDGDATEARTGAEAFFEITFVAEDRAEARCARDRAGDDERLFEPVPHGDLLGFHRARIHSDEADLTTEPRSLEGLRREERRADRDEERDARRAAFE